MKSFVNAFRSSPSSVVIYVVEVFALVFVLSLVFSEKAHAQSGNIYAPQQAQVAGDVMEGDVLQVSVKDVESNTEMRAVGAAVGGVLGLALASRSGTVQNRFAVNTVGSVLGGLLGERATSKFATSRAQEIILRVQPQGGMQPRTMVIVQPAPFEAVSAGDKVFVTLVNGAWRVIRRSTL